MWEVKIWFSVAIWIHLYLFTNDKIVAQEKYKVNTDGSGEKRISSLV